MTAERQPVADPPDDVDGRPVAATVAVLCGLVVLAFVAYGVWLGANQCVRIGGCG